MARPYGALISIVVPAFNEEGNIRPLVEAVERALSEEPAFELIVVDDGSRDATLSELKAASLGRPWLRYLSFSRNFGHQVALKAGLDHALGDCIITMDADMQHPPERLIEMLARWREDYDIVYMLRLDDPSLPWTKRTASRLFYKVLTAVSDFSFEPGSSDFRLLDRAVVDIIRDCGEQTVFLRGLVPWLGFNQLAIPYTPNNRVHGNTKYSFRKMVALAVDGVVSSSLRPLQLSTYLGLFMAAFAMAYMIYAVIARIIYGLAISGWASILSSAMLIGGVQLLILGIIGQYTGKIWLQVRGRPLYIVRQTNIVPMDLRQRVDSRAVHSLSPVAKV